MSPFSVTSAKMFSCFKTLASSFVLATVKQVDEIPNREATPAREAPMGIPIPVSEVASPAEESKEQTDPRLIAEPWATVCALLYFF